MSDYTKDDTIFVQIASYRDPELQHTLQDLFKKAKRPENITVGICHQYDMKSDEDKHLFEVPFSNPKQLRIDEVDYRESQGACWARSRVQKLWKAEKWTLMIDSHMRFEEGWDEDCVYYANKLSSIKQGDAVISNMPSDCLPGKDYSDTVCKPNFNKFLDGIIPFGFGCFLTEKTEKSAMISARFLFGLSKNIFSIPYDKFLYFFGEEVTLAIRIWTSGYNLFSIKKIIAHHKRISKEDVEKLFNVRPDNDPEKNIRANLHKHDRRSDDVAKQNNCSLNRVKHLLNTKKSDDSEVLKEIENYGFGNKRTFRDYERFSGIDFRKRKMREHSKFGVFEEWNEVASISAIKLIYSAN